MCPHRSTFGLASDVEIWTARVYRSMKPAAASALMYAEFCARVPLSVARYLQRGRSGR